MAKIIIKKTLDISTLRILQRPTRSSSVAHCGPRPLLCESLTQSLRSHLWVCLWCHSFWRPLKSWTQWHQSRTLISVSVKSVNVVDVFSPTCSSEPGPNSINKHYKPHRPTFRTNFLTFIHYSINITEIILTDKENNKGRCYFNRKKTLIFLFFFLHFPPYLSSNFLRSL